MPQRGRTRGAFFCCQYLQFSEKYDIILKILPIFSLMPERRSRNMSKIYFANMGVRRVSPAYYLTNLLCMGEKEKEVIKIFQDILKEQEKQNSLLSELKSEIEDQWNDIYSIKAYSFWFFVFYIFLPLVFFICSVFFIYFLGRQFTWFL